MRRRRLTALLAVCALFCCLPAASAGATTTASFDDPVGDSLEFAADLGATTVTVGDDDAVSVDTLVTPRPPAGWGGCSHYVVGICMPSDMTLTWYLDYAAGAGSLADDGADAKVLVVPQQGTSTWEGSRWDAAAGSFSAGARPLGSEDSDSARWSLRLSDLGVPRPATVRIWAVSLYRSFNGLGQQLSYEDKAGPGTVTIPGPPPTLDPAASLPCKRKADTVNRLQRRLRTLRRAAKRGEPGAARKLRRLRATKGRAVKAMVRRCGPPVAEPPATPAPTAAPPGCELVTKPVLQQEGTGIFAPWVVKPEVVVECD